MIDKHLRLTYSTRAMHLEGDLRGAIAHPGKWWVDFQNKLRAIGFRVDQISKQDEPTTQGDPPPDSPEDVEAHPWKRPVFRCEADGEIVAPENIFDGRHVTERNETRNGIMLTLCGHVHPDAEATL